MADHRLTMTADERRRVRARHYRVGAEDLGLLVSPWEQYQSWCGFCGEPWDPTYGCPTMKLVKCYDALEQVRKEEQLAADRRIDELQEALAPHFRASQFMEHRQLYLKLVVSEDVMLQGRMELVEYVLHNLLAHYRRWWKDVGDKARMERDHVYALSLDAERVQYLSFFDPKAPVEFTP